MRHKRIYIRVSEKELEGIEEKAKRYGMDKSSFIRMMALQGEMKISPTINTKEDIKMKKTMKIHWKHEGRKYTGYATWYENSSDKYISFTSDDGHRVFDQVDANECYPGITLADIWQDIVDRGGDITNFELK